MRVRTFPFLICVQVKLILNLVLTSHEADNATHFIKERSNHQKPKRTIFPAKKHVNKFRDVESSRYLYVDGFLNTNKELERGKYKRRVSEKGDLRYETDRGKDKNSFENWPKQARKKSRKITFQDNVNKNVEHGVISRNQSHHKNTNKTAKRKIKDEKNTNSELFKYEQYVYDQFNAEFTRNYSRTNDKIVKYRRFEAEKHLADPVDFYGEYDGDYGTDTKIKDKEKPIGTTVNKNRLQINVYLYSKSTKPELISAKEPDKELPKSIWSNTRSVGQRKSFKIDSQNQQVFHSVDFNDLSGKGSIHGVVEQYGSNDVRNQSITNGETAQRFPPGEQGNGFNPGGPVVGRFGPSEQIYGQSPISNFSTGNRKDQYGPIGQVGQQFGSGFRPGELRPEGGKISPENSQLDPGNPGGFHPYGPVNQGFGSRPRYTFGPYRGRPDDAFGSNLGEGFSPSLEERGMRQGGYGSTNVGFAPGDGFYPDVHEREFTPRHDYYELRHHQGGQGFEPSESRFVPARFVPGTIQDGDFVPSGPHNVGFEPVKSEGGRLTPGALQEVGLNPGGSQKNPQVEYVPGLLQEGRQRGRFDPSSPQKDRFGPNWQGNSHRTSFDTEGPQGNPYQAAIPAGGHLEEIQRGRFDIYRHEGNQQGVFRPGELEGYSHIKPDSRPEGPQRQSVPEGYVIGVQRQNGQMQENYGQYEQVLGNYDAGNRNSYGPVRYYGPGQSNSAFRPFVQPIPGQNHGTIQPNVHSRPGPDVNYPEIPIVERPDLSGQNYEVRSPGTFMTFVSGSFGPEELGQRQNNERENTERYYSESPIRYGGVYKGTYPRQSPQQLGYVNVGINTWQSGSEVNDHGRKNPEKNARSYAQTQGLLKQTTVFGLTKFTEYNETSFQKFRDKLRNRMLQLSSGYFTMFLSEFFKLLGMKTDDDVGSILGTLEPVLQEYNSRGLLSQFGQPLTRMALKWSKMYEQIGKDVIRFYLNLYRYSVDHRQEVINKDINSFVDQIDKLYLEEEGDQIIKLLYEMDKYPNANYTARDIVKDMFEKVILNTVNRVKDRKECDVLIHSVNDYLNIKIRENIGRNNTNRRFDDDFKGHIRFTR